MNPTGRLAGRCIIISGAASGIGQATASTFRREGAAVALLDRNETALKATIEQLSATDGPTVLGLAVDVTQTTELEAAIQQASEQLDGLDGIVSSAGIDCLKPFPDMTHADWQNVLNVNLTGPFNLCLAALPYMQQAGKGTIVHIASGAALRPLSARTAYCASKAGLVMFAKTLAVDLAAYSIRVNAVCPGIIDTPLFRQSIDNTDDPTAELERLLDRYLIRRIGKPEDIANAALYLSCDESAHVTGTALAVDGGRTFH